MRVRLGLLAALLSEAKRVAPPGVTHEQLANACAKGTLDKHLHAEAR